MADPGLPRGAGARSRDGFYPSLLWIPVGSEGIPLTLLEPTLLPRQLVPCVHRQTEGLSALLPSRAGRSLRVLRSGCSHPLISPFPSTPLTSLLNSPTWSVLLHRLARIPCLSSLVFQVFHRFIFMGFFNPLLFLATTPRPKTSP